MKMTLNPLFVAISASLMIAGNLVSEEKHSDHAGKEKHSEHMLAGYLAVSDALFKDDLAGAKRSAAELAGHDEESALSEPALAIASAKDIAGAREAFKNLSASAATLVGADGADGYVVMLCPMVKGGNGIWLSADGKVNNPYFGARMPHCGGPKK